MRETKSKRRTPSLECAFPHDSTNYELPTQSQAPATKSFTQRQVVEHAPAPVPPFAVPLSHSSYAPRTPSPQTVLAAAAIPTVGAFAGQAFTFAAAPQTPC